MNERIRGFQVEAWDYACSKIPPNALGQKNHEDYFAEKFADLMIKEFVDIVPWQYEETIKKHFGVEW